MKTDIEKALQETFFLNREKNFSHTTYDVEMLQYETLKRGEDEAIPLGKQAFESAEPHLLSKDKLRGWKYMFVASTTHHLPLCHGRRHGVGDVLQPQRPVHPACGFM